MYKISSIFRTPNGTQEPFELKFSDKKMNILEIVGEILVSGKFMRVTEGIMMLIESLDAVQVVPCSLCGKTLKLPLGFKPSEWLYYENAPGKDDDENEHLRIDVHRLEIDPSEPVRQDLILNLEWRPHCKKICKKYEEAVPGHEGVKALIGLKDLRL